MKTKLIPIGILIFIILVSGCVQQGPPEDEQATQPSETLPQPPSGEVSIYKGFWMPCGYLSDDCQPMSNMNLLKSTGANIVGIGPTVKINSEGEVRFEVSIDYIEKTLSRYAEKYYEEGIRIHLVIEILYVEDFSEGVPAGGPPAFPEDVVGKPGFLDEYNLLVENMAELAEKYQVEFFSPMNEPDMKLGIDASSDWGQEILPRVKEHYTGKVLYKAAFIGMEDYNKLDFSGYDAIGIDISPGGGPMDVYPDEVDILLDNVLAWASRDNVPDVLFTEFGVWGGALNFDEETKARAHEIVFEQGKGRVKGFLALDPPPDLDRSIEGTKTLEVITEWFKEKL